MENKEKNAGFGPIAGPGQSEPGQTGVHIQSPPPIGKIDNLKEQYTDAELVDVNNISVTVPDTRTPIVVLFGAPSCGKTVILFRMIQFLEQKCQLNVIPEEVFRPQSDRRYSKMCRDLKDMVYSQYAPPSTDYGNFMLTKVLDRVGNPIVQFLEAPGEHYFDGSSNLDFPAYINAIRTSVNRKKWVFIVEQDWGGNADVRNRYAQKICAMQGLIPPTDQVIFLFNKVDLKRGTQYKKNGEPNMAIFKRNIEEQYPGIFSRYQNTGLNKFFYGADNFRTICFSSGVFNPTNDGRKTWTREKDSYCADFWNAIR